MSTNINTLTSAPVVELSSSFTPAGVYTYTAPNGTVVTAPKAAINTHLTFSATVASYNPTAIPFSLVEYRWDFGDGTIGYGPSPAHTYIVPNLQAFYVLRITDSFGHRWYSRQQLYLS